MIPSEFLEAFLGFTVTAGDVRVVPNNCRLGNFLLEQTEARGGVEVDTIAQVC